MCVVCSHKLPLSETKESCSRADAQLLLQHLEGVMPDGAISSKYRRAVNSSGDAIQLYHDVSRIKKDYVMVDATLRECGRQIASECLDRTRVTEKVSPCFKSTYEIYLFDVLCVPLLLPSSSRHIASMNNHWQSTTISETTVSYFSRWVCGCRLGSAMQRCSTLCCMCCVSCTNL